MSLWDLMSLLLLFITVVQIYFKQYVRLAVTDLPLTFLNVSGSFVLFP